MSLRAQTILILLAALAIAGFAHTVITASVVQRLQNQLREDIRRISREQIDQLAKDIAVGLEENADQPDLLDVFEAHPSWLLRGTHERVVIQLTDLVETSGTLMITNRGGQVTARRLSTPDPENALRAGLYTESRDIFLKGQQVGVVKMVMSQAIIDARVAASTSEVKRSIRSSVIVSLGLLLGTGFLLWQAFRRHVRLVERSARLGQMAYVGQLAGGLAHEIRNPLHAMNINLQVVEEEIEDPRDDSPGKVRSILKRLRGEVGELNTSLSQFLEYARPERSRPEWTDVRDLLMTVVAPLRPRLERIGGTFRLDVDAAFASSGGPPTGRNAGAPGPSFARIQPAAIRQALTNVVSNAVQALEELAAAEDPPAGWKPNLTIRFRAERDGDVVAIDVIDNGPGIGSAHLPRVFDVFYSTKPGGSGFGLAISRRAFVDHGGNITVASKPGAGARFTMTLPRGGAERT